VVAAAETRTFAVNAREIADIDDWVEAVGRRWGHSERTVLRARLCLAELAANVLEHAAPRAGDRITITLHHLSDGLGIELVDTCGLFDPTGVAMPSADVSIATARPGGRGLKLVHAFSVDLSYCNNDGRNRVSLKIASA
jgi:anti-sigma regulatory factor (Ser/Thr protein kinase)